MSAPDGGILEGSPQPPARPGDAKGSSALPAVRVRRPSEGSSPLHVEAWPHLGEEVLACLRQAGTTRATTAGEVLFQLDQDRYDFVFVEEGSVAIVGRADDRSVSEIVAGDFIGELGMLMGRRTFYAGAVVPAGQVVTAPVEALPQLIATARSVKRVAPAVGEGSVVISSVHAHLGEPRPVLSLRRP